MKIFDEMEKRGHEELIFNYFGDVDLKLIISLHDTTLGRAIGGLRMNQYDSEMDAIIESLRLSQGMTYQCVTADTDGGGGNALLYGNPKTDKNEAYFRALGRFIESLKRKLNIYPDLGTDVLDFKYIQRETGNTIFDKEIDDSSKSTARITAYGVYWGIKACAKEVFTRDNLSGLSFAVQGLGNVGKILVDLLLKEKATLYISDLVYDNIKVIEDRHPDADVHVVKPDELLYQETDFIVPCAVGSIIDAANVDRLNCKVIAGAAYNIFADESLIEKAHENNILYAPAFVISAGDLFLLNKNLKLGDVESSQDRTKIIYDILLDILRRARSRSISPYQVAKEDAIERYKKIDQIKNILC